MRNLISQQAQSQSVYVLTLTGDVANIKAQEKTL